MNRTQPPVIVPAREVPFQRTIPARIATTILTVGDNKDFTEGNCSFDQWHDFDFPCARFWRVCEQIYLCTITESPAFLNNGNDLHFVLRAQFVSLLFHCLFDKVKEEHDQEGHQSHSNQSEVPIKPKHPNTTVKTMVFPGRQRFRALKMRQN